MKSAKGKNPPRRTPLAKEQPYNNSLNDGETEAMVRWLTGAVSAAISLHAQWGMLLAPDAQSNLDTPLTVEHMLFAYMTGLIQIQIMCAQLKILSSTWELSQRISPLLDDLGKTADETGNFAQMLLDEWALLVVTKN